MTEKHAYILNPDGSYMSEEEIINDIIINIDEPTKEFISNGYKRELTDEEKQMSEEIGLNPNAFQTMQFARWIRNSYGLWATDNPYVKLNPNPNNEGIIDDPLFPDNISMNIMKKLVEKLNIKE